MIVEFVFAAMFTFVFFLHEKYRIRDEQVSDESTSRYLKKQWHKAKGGLQLVVFTYVGYKCYEQYGSWFYSIAITLFCASLFWMFHDGLLNSFLFKKEWWYTGTTGTIDKKLGRSSVSVAKSVCLGISIILLILWKIFY